MIFKYFSGWWDLYLYRLQLDNVITSLYKNYCITYTKINLFYVWIMDKKQGAPSKFNLWHNPPRFNTILKKWMVDRIVKKTKITLLFLLFCLYPLFIFLSLISPPSPTIGITNTLHDHQNHNYHPPLPIASTQN